VIPSGLPFPAIDPAAASNSARKQLFDAVGVKKASVTEVRSALHTKYRNGRLTLAESVDYLRFLFLTQRFARLECGLLIFNHRGVLENGWLVDIYIDSDDPYCTKSLFSPTAPGFDHGRGAPGLGVSFVHEAYFENAPILPNPTNNDVACWEDWLATACHVSKSVSVYDCEKGELTSAAKYVAQYRPEKFLGLLRESWARGLGSKVRSDNRIIDAIGQIPVLCQGPGTSLYPIKRAYLPYGEPLELGRRFMTEDEHFPWLKLEAPLSGTAPLLEWSGLISAFGLGHNGQLLDLALDMLEHICEDQSAEPLERPDRIHQLYGYLQSKIGESSDHEGCRGKIRFVQNFEANGMVLTGYALRMAFTSGRCRVYLPNTNYEGKSWVTPEDCLWSAPVDLAHAAILKRIYCRAFSLSQDQILLLETFFVHTLNVPVEANSIHIVKEIQFQKCFGTMTLSRATGLYTCLSDMDLTTDECSLLRYSPHTWAYFSQYGS
jgi:hypothetical protein